MSIESSALTYRLVHLSNYKQSCLQTVKVGNEFESLLPSNCWTQPLMFYLDLKFVEGIACFVQDITKKEKKVLEYKMLFLKGEKWWGFF